MVDLHDLDSFEQGLPVPPGLSPAEVRRRGDRLRRRRTAGYAAAGVLSVALAVGVPSVALSGHSGSDDIQPAPRPSQTAPPNGWVTTIPAAFPLTSGFADPNATPGDRLAQDPSLTVACGSDGFTGFTDNAVVTYQGESEDRAVRILVVYPDAAAAAAELADLRDTVEGCAPTPVNKGTSMVTEPVAVDLGTEESFGFAQQIQHTDGLVSDLSLFEVARTGNAIYVDMSYTAAGGDQVVAAEQRRLMRAAQEPLGSMCEFAVDPCAGG